MANATRRADLRISGALLIDGTGGEAREGDLVIRDGRIEAMGDAPGFDAAETLSADGLAVSPGFIDIHTHCLASPCDNYLAQGVTTVVGGNCGTSPLDLARVVKALERSPIGPNLALLVGFNAARVAVVGRAARAPDAAELERMRELVRTMIEQGAFGVSSGLQYPPGCYSQTDEVVETVRAAAPFGGFYASHIRDEGADLVEAVNEALEIGRRSGLGVHVSHLKAAGRAHWGKVSEALATLEAARRDGMDVTQDAYPYTAGCGPVGLLAPGWAQEGEPEEVRERLSDGEMQARFLAEVEAKLDTYYGGDLTRVRVAGCREEPELAGCTLADISVARGGAADCARDGARVVMDLLSRHSAPASLSCVLHMIGDDDVETVLRDPYTMIASDGWNTSRALGGHPHPRLSGTFPRALGYYGRERNLWTLPEAVRKMTGLPAKRLGLGDRGVLAEGAWADVVVFDPNRVRDGATFEDPFGEPEGIEAVLIGGRFAMRDGRLTGERPGRLLKHGV